MVWSGAGESRNWSSRSGSDAAAEVAGCAACADAALATTASGERMDDDGEEEDERRRAGVALVTGTADMPTTPLLSVCSTILVRRQGGEAVAGPFSPSALLCFLLKKNMAARAPNANPTTTAPSAMPATAPLPRPGLLIAAPPSAAPRAFVSSAMPVGVVEVLEEPLVEALDDDREDDLVSAAGAGVIAGGGFVDVCGGLLSDAGRGGAEDGGARDGGGEGGGGAGESEDGGGFGLAERGGGDDGAGGSADFRSSLGVGAGLGSLGGGLEGSPADEGASAMSVRKIAQVIQQKPRLRRILPKSRRCTSMKGG